jgi:hypothetical protein
MPLSNELESLQNLRRRIRLETAKEAGVSEATAAAWALSPSHQGFFFQLKPYISKETGNRIDLEAVAAEWDNPDEPDRTQRLLQNLEIDQLVETRENGEVLITDLGRRALRYIFPEHQ